MPRTSSSPDARAPRPAPAPRRAQGQSIADLDEKRGFFEDIRSLKIACAGSGSAAAGSTGQQKDGQAAQQKGK
jgi:hypothetical protein